MIAIKNLSEVGKNFSYLHSRGGSQEVTLFVFKINRNVSVRFIHDQMLQSVGNTVTTVVQSLGM